MIWNAATLGHVRSLRVQMALDGQTLLRDPDQVILYVKRKLADQLVHMAEPYGAMIDLRDVEFTEREGAAFPHGVLVRARWFPAHGIVELHGGQRDGEVVEVAPQMIGQPIIFPVLLDDSAGYLAEGKLDPIPTGNLEYRPAGWREETRTWIYRYYL